MTPGKPTTWCDVSADAAWLDAGGERIEIVGDSTEWRFSLNGEQVAVRPREGVGNLAAAKLTAFVIVGSHFGALIRDAARRRERFTAVARAATVAACLRNTPATSTNRGAR